MDDRQTQIREGAGLEDSRVNQEFIDFLNKWSSPVIMTLAVAALVWAGLQFLERKKIARIDQAFSEFASATSGGNPSPASLKTIASEYAGVRSVSELALLRTTDLYLNAFVVGYEPGALMDPLTGLPADETDVLDDERKQSYLSQAGTLANQVLDSTNGVEGKELIAMQALSRLASVKEGQRDFAGAKGVYEQLASTATSNQFGAIATFAQNRIAQLGELESVDTLPSADQLSPLPGEETPALTQEQIQELINSAAATSELEMESDATDESATDPEADPEAGAETESQADPEVDPSDETPAP